MVLFLSFVWRSSLMAPLTLSSFHFDALKLILFPRVLSFSCLVCSFTLDHISFRTWQRCDCASEQLWHTFTRPYTEWRRGHWASCRRPCHLQCILLCLLTLYPFLSCIVGSWEFRSPSNLSASPSEKDPTWNGHCARPIPLPSLSCPNLLLRPSTAIESQTIYPYFLLISPSSRSFWRCTSSNHSRISRSSYLTSSKLSVWMTRPKTLSRTLRCAWDLWNRSLLSSQWAFLNILFGLHHL